MNLTSTLNSDLVNLSEWSKENRMFINVEKNKDNVSHGKKNSV